MNRLLIKSILIIIMVTNMNVKADEIIPREILFGNPEKTSVQLNNNGKYISYVAPLNGVLNVWIAPVDKPLKATAITDDTGKGIRSYGWTWHDDYIIYAQDKDGDENSRLYSINIKNKKKILLSPENNVRAGVKAIDKDKPDEILISHNQRDPKYFDIYKVNIKTGKSEVFYENKDGYTGLWLNDKWRIVIAQKMLANGDCEFYKFSKDGKHKGLFFTIKNEDMIGSDISHMTKDGKKFYLFDTSGRNNSALYEVDVETGEKTEIFYDAKNDISGNLTNPKTYEVQAVETTYLRSKWHIIDKSLSSDFAALKNVEDGDLHILSRTYEDDKWIVAYSNSDAPHSYYLYDREKKEIRFLFTHDSKKEKLPLAKMHSVEIKAQDGLILPSYLTVPRWLDDGHGNVKNPVPLILFVHGGPNARDDWGFDSTVQWLANRGYAVLQVNYRGSSGFGKDFVNAGDGEWAGKMQRDLEDGVQWCIEKGITTRDKVVIMGGSYGGYATLVGITMTPDLYAAGVDIVGISNLETFEKSIPEYWKPYKAHTDKMMGVDTATAEGKEVLRKKSPINYVNDIKRPLFIVHGAHDPRVNKNESDQIVAAMKAKNIPYIYLLYPNEGHGLARPENKMSMTALIESFLANILGGKLEPHDNKFPGSSVEIQEGSHMEWIDLQ